MYVVPGEAESDLSRTLSFRVVDPPLTEHGRAQVERLAAGLRAEVARGRDLYPEIFTSPLKRAVETATILGAELGGSPAPDDRLREINVGELDGRGDEDAWAMHAEIVHRQWGAGEWSRRFPGGEHLRNLAQRIRAALLAAAAAAGAGAGAGGAPSDVIVVGHATGLRAALPYLLDNAGEVSPQTDLGPASLTRITAGPVFRPTVLALQIWDAHQR